MLLMLAGTFSSAEAAARKLVDGKAKPPGSLGRLEEWGIRLAALQRTLQPRVSAATLLVFAADHGVTKTHPQVSAYPRTVTPAMYAAIAAGQAASSVLCAANDCFLTVIDVGIDADIHHITAVPGSHVSATHSKVCHGTSSFVNGPAMTEQQCQQALAAGAAAVEQACKHMQQATATPATTAAADHTQPSRLPPSQCVICVGELGIGNTTAAAALLAALSGASPQEVCGRGTGVDNVGLSAKQQVVAAALAANQQLIQSGPLGALQAVGGLELGAMTGAYLAAAERQMPAIVDGFVSGAAALAAVRQHPEVAQCLFLSHTSAEAGTQRLLAELGQLPVLDMGLRLGEGTGAVLSVPILRSAAAMVSDMASLDEVLTAAAATAAGRDKAG